MGKPKIIIHITNGLVENVMADRDIELVVLDADTEIWEEDEEESIFSLDTYGEQAFYITVPGVDVTKRTQVVFDEAMEKVWRK
jgi:hypothetical protein